eukprot:5820686-Pyramimonas_sp.AAC.1
MGRQSNTAQASLETDCNLQPTSWPSWGLLGPWELPKDRVAPCSILRGPRGALLERCRGIRGATQEPC